MENAADILATGLLCATGAYLIYKALMRLAETLIDGVQHVTRRERD